MRYQQNIYNQNGNKVRNRDLLNVNMSSDIDIFKAPTFNASGGTKIDDSSDNCNFSGLSFTDILTAATQSCSGLTLSNISEVSWNLEIEKNGVLVHNNTIANTPLTATPTENQFLGTLQKGLNSLNYEYTYNDSILEVSKPFGASDMSIKICAEITPISAITCTAYCETVCYQTYNVTTSASTGVYNTPSSATDITLEFNFTGNTSSFTEDTNFKFEIYKFNHSSRVFAQPAIYKSDEIPYPSFSATNIVNIDIPISQLNIDGDYLIKGYYEYDVKTDILSRLSLVNDTSNVIIGTKYGIYEPKNDYYFIVVAEAEIPVLGRSIQNTTRPLGSLVAFSILPTGQTEFDILTSVQGELLVYLNGLLLSNHLDYSYTNNKIKLSGQTYNGDVLTYVSVANSQSNGLTVDNINITNTIVSGTVNNQGINKVYYNTTNSKYEIYTTLTPMNGQDISITLNGASLANNIDYYQSISNPKRLILTGTLLVGDIINVIYSSYPSYVGDIYTNTPKISWYIKPPTNNNGEFTVEVATDNTFTNIVSSATTQYVANQSAYNTTITVAGQIGIEYVYRIKNTKKYTILSGDIIESIKYSESIPIRIMSNAINSY